MGGSAVTVEIVYDLPRALSASKWQVDIARQIESNRGFPIQDIERELVGTTLYVRVETDLPNNGVENMLSDIEGHLPQAASHVETREV